MKIRSQDEVIMSNNLRIKKLTPIEDLPGVKRRVIEHHVRCLGELGCDVKVIHRGSQEQWGELVTVAPKRTRNIQHKGITRHFRPFVKDMQIGDAEKIPAGPFPLSNIQCALTSWASKHWGPSCYKTGVNVDENVVEIVRLSAPLVVPDFELPANLI